MRRAAALVSFVCCLTAGDGAREADAYRFLGDGRLGPFFHDAGETKPLWDPAVWGPGQTVTVAVPDDPRWLGSGSLRSMAELRRLVSEAMRMWSRLGSADILWVVGASDCGEAPICIVVREDIGAGRAGWFRDFGLEGRLEARRCQVWINPSYEEGDLARLRVLIAHELGHCLGLHHQWQYPNRVPYPTEEGTDWLPMWGVIELMAVPNHEPFAALRRVSFTGGLGASLLRPAPGWLAGTGTVYGTVLGVGDQARAAVLVARLGVDGRVRDAVTRMTNEWGQFAMEGLPPGTYVAMVYGTRRNVFEGLVPIRHTVLLDPLEVRAGERTGPLVLTARPRGVRE